MYQLKGRNKIKKKKNNNNSTLVISDFDIKKRSTTQTFRIDLYDSFRICAYKSPSLFPVLFKTTFFIGINKLNSLHQLFFFFFFVLLFKVEIKKDGKKYT